MMLTPPGVKIEIKEVHFLERNIEISWKYSSSKRLEKEGQPAAEELVWILHSEEFE